MWIIQMQPQEERLAARAPQPFQSLIDAVACLPLNQSRIVLQKTAALEHVVIQLEAPIEPPTPVENIRAHDGGGIVSLRLERLRHAADVRAERIPGKVLHAIVKWVSSREQASMTRQREWNLRISMLKQQARSRQFVDCRSLGLLVSVSP